MSIATTSRRGVDFAKDSLRTIDVCCRDDAPRVNVEMPGFSKLVDASGNSAIRLERSDEGAGHRQPKERQSLKGSVK
jgi:hypothetical protein